jgi:NADPH2:quinone reductase
MGATVIGVARGAAKQAKAAGADHVIDASEDIITAARLGGADVVYDPVGGPSLQAALRATNREGRIVIIAFAAATSANSPTAGQEHWSSVLLGGYLKFNSIQR